jgi:hypothetical protein
MLSPAQQFGASLKVIKQLVDDGRSVKKSSSTARALSVTEYFTKWAEGWSRSHHRKNGAERDRLGS